MFSKAEKFYKIPKGREQFNERLKRYVLQDTAYTLYRMSAKAIDENTYKYRNVKIKLSEAVDFYMDRMGRFRKVEVSVYLNENQYKELLKNGGDFRDITPESVRKLNNDKYSILRKSSPGTLQTTLFILEDTETRNSNQRYFVCISRMNMKIADDRFYKELNDDVKFQKKL